MMFLMDNKSNLPDLVEALLGAATTGGLGALPVMFRRLWPAVVQEWEQNASRCLRAAVHSSGMSREDLEEAITQDPSTVSLTARALHYAGMNSADEALITMGAAVGSSLNSNVDTSTDDAGLIVEAARGLSPRHVQVLRLLRTRRVNDDGQQMGWTRDALPEAMDLSSLSAHMLLDSCVGAGTVTTHSGYGALMYDTSELGAEILKLLDDLSIHLRDN